MKSGDENTKKFQQFAKGRKAINTIWELKCHIGREAKSFSQLADLGVRHFSNIYKDPRGTNITEILRVAEAMPRFVEEEEEESLIQPVTLGELEAAMKGFSKDKSLGPDGWPIEFYITIFELIG